MGRRRPDQAVLRTQVRGRRWLLLFPLVLALGLGALLLSVRVEGSAAAAAAEEKPPLAVPTRPARRALATPDAPFIEKERRRQEIRLWQDRLAQAQETLASYRESTRYPPESRPIREHPDHVYPSFPERQALLDEEDPTGVRLLLTQEHVFVAGDQTVDLWVRCEDAMGGAAPCVVSSAQVLATGSVKGSRAFPPVPLVFADNGGPGDAIASDGILSARFQPSHEGFAGYEGRLRVVVEVTSGQTQGQAFFDLTYTGPVPAAFTGEVRETLQDGILVLSLEVQVRTPGRYVVDARVDDARGRPFAYVDFNEELQVGRQEIPLTVYGKLIQDEQPAFPLRLRDVEGFLLLEDRDPDRQLMLPLRGPVHTTRTYPVTAFLDAEWRSEERDRHLDEFSRDVREARAHLEGLAHPP